jgi:hypothetical protein
MGEQRCLGTALAAGMNVTSEEEHQRQHKEQQEGVLSIDSGPV